MIGRGARRTMPPRSRTRAGTSTRAGATTRTGPSGRGRPLDALADQAPAQHPVQSPGHFLGQVRTAASNRRTGPPTPTRLLAQRLSQPVPPQARLGQAASPEPSGGTIAPQSRHSTSPNLLTRCTLEHREQRSISDIQSTVSWHPGTDENLALPPHPAFPRALPAAGVGLPHTTSIAGHPGLLRSSRVAWLTAGPTHANRVSSGRRAPSCTRRCHAPGEWGSPLSTG